MVSRIVYRLPFDGGIEPAFAPYHDESKWQSYALDFPMVEGTPIYAAFRGQVSEVKDGSNTGGPYKSLVSKTNLVVLDHEKGEFTHYAHLKSGIVVKKGQYVYQGDLLGYSGSTGYATYPHLHFAVCIRDGSGFQTILPRFRKDCKVFTLQSHRE